MLTINDDFDLIMSNDVDHYTLKDSCKTLSIRSEKETTDNQLSFSRFAVTYISSINKTRVLNGMGISIITTSPTLASSPANII